ncbi:MAG: hypothetical protein E7422_11300 [Ruminococcaceae bacterium]|nr:hypothetical protein [Oscillospiraceae bacterium]
MKPYINPQTGEEIRTLDRVLTFGLSEEENAFLEKHLPNKQCELMPTDFVTDLYAYKSVAVIIRAQALSARGLHELESYYRELENTPTLILWLGEPKLSARLMRMTHYYDALDDLRDELKSLLTASYKQINEIRTMREELTLTIRVLRLIEQYPGIRSRAIAETLSISKRSVQRYIHVLRCADDSVQYDASVHGWVVGASFSPDETDHPAKEAAQ